MTFCDRCQEFVDDLAMTSMARLWDVGKSEPIKAGVSDFSRKGSTMEFAMVLPFRV